MEFVLDNDVQAVAEFMQDNVPAAKLRAVAESLPKLARLLWEDIPQEPLQPASLKVTCLGRADAQQPSATVLAGMPSVGDGSGAAAVSR